MKTKKKIELSKGNHLQLKKRGSSWVHQTGTISRRVFSFRTECRRAASDIGRTYEGRTIFVFLSGGMDSEVVAESFRLAGVNFVPLIIEYENGFNQPDVTSALAWCAKRLMKPKRVQFNLERFFSSRWPKEKAAHFVHTMPVYLVLMKVFESLPRDSVGILGSGEPLLIHHRKGDYLEEVYDELSLFRFALESQRPFITHFFFWTPELYFAFISSPEYFDFLRQKGEIYRRSFPFKEKLYRREFKLKDRPKRHGFELVMRQYSDLMSSFKFKSRIKNRYIPYQAEIAYLTSRNNFISR